MKKHKNPLPAVDIIIEHKNGIVLIERKNPPYGWAIPGGFVEYNETLEDAAAREAKEETGLDIFSLRQFHSYSGPRRDPRWHTIATVFTAQGRGKLRAATDAGDVGIFDKKNLPQKFAFDHKRIIRDFYCFKDGKEPQW
ncbi:MAG: NUDIX hydrolase [Candidatus Omnitrophota bacterium]